MEATLFQNGPVYLDSRFRSVSLLVRAGKIAAVDGSGFAAISSFFASLGKQLASRR